jgi:hypothetical protein
VFFSEWDDGVNVCKLDLGALTAVPWHRDMFGAGCYTLPLAPLALRPPSIAYLIRNLLCWYLFVIAM